MGIVSFQVTEGEMKTIRSIVDRAVRLAYKYDIIELDRIDLEMDLCAVHANGCPINFDVLLAADDLNFAHDVFGIVRHLDRTTGKLGNFYLPRFAVPQGAVVGAGG